MLHLVRSKERAAFAEAVCAKGLRIDPEVVSDKLESMAASLLLSQTAGSVAARPAPQSREALLADLDSKTRSLLTGMDAEVCGAAEGMLRDPRLIERISADIQAIGVVGERDLALTTYLIGTSRLLAKPLSGIIQGVTCSGKSFVPMRVATLFPEEGVVMATDITPNALYYAEPGSLVHRFVVAGERPRAKDDQRAEATRALREMLESGVLNKMVSVKRPDGRIASQRVQQAGPIAYVESTTVAQVFEEDRNRSLMLATDESEEQTARVVKAQARGAVAGGQVAGGIIARHQALQRILKRVNVEVPFAERLAESVPVHRQEARRAMPMILAMVKTVALLHQLQRGLEAPGHGDVIRASVEDYMIARRLLVGPIGRALGGGLPEAVARFGQRLAARFQRDVFSSTDAWHADQVLSSKGKVNEYLRVLADSGCARCVEPAKGINPALWNMAAAPASGQATWLPTADQIGGA